MLSGFVLAIVSAACTADPIVVHQVQPQAPKSVLDTVAGTREATVAVTLDASGKLTRAAIYRSSGYSALDAAALEAAMRSQYAPGKTNCGPSGGTFGVQFSFEGNARLVPGAQCPREVTLLRAVAPAVEQNPTNDVWEEDARVAVTVLPDGSVWDAMLVHSSGNAQRDHAAVLAARTSTYKPKLILSADGRTCEAVTGTYYFRASFVH